MRMVRWGVFLIVAFACGARADEAALRAAQIALSQGRLAKARLAFEALNDADDSQTRAAALIGSGAAATLLGELDVAARFLSRGHDAARAIEDDALVAAAENQRGLLALALGDPSEALARFEASTGLHADPEHRARAAINMARAARAIGDRDRARAALDRAAEALKPTFDPRLGVALGEGFAELGADAQAYDALAEAAAEAARRADAAAEAIALAALAALYEAVDRLDDAFALANGAVSAAARSADPAAAWRAHALLGRLHLRRNDGAGAEKAFAAAADDLDAVRASGRTVPRASTEAVFLGMADAHLRQAFQDTPEDKDRAQHLRSARAAAERLKSVELQEYFQDACAAETALAVADPDAPAPNAATLYPILLPDRAVIIVASEGRIDAAESVAPLARIALEARNLRTRLQRFGDPRYLAQARRLHAILIDPVADILEGWDVDTLVIAPDGPLRTIPFAALHDGDTHLIQRYAMSVTPSLDVLPAPARRSRRPAAVMGAVSDGVQGYAPLPGVTEEVRAVGALIESSVLLNEGFDPGPIRRALTSNTPDFVHIASHGEFGGSYGDSYLLTYTDRLTLNQLDRLIRDTRGPEAPIDLLALSACSTADGDDRAALGLAGVALKAGARSAIASLWEVSDAAATRLIERFYAEYFVQGVSKAEALRRAQLDLLSQQATAHPAYWSPFLLVGATD